MAERIGIAPEDFCDTKTQEPLSWLSEKTNGQGVDVFFECIGKNEIVKLAIDAVTPGGRIMLVGNPASDMMLEKGVYWQILRKQLTLAGSWNSNYNSRVNDWKEAISIFESGEIDLQGLISRTYPMSEHTKAFADVRDKNTFTLRVMFTMD